jgi:prepilin-type N-terminal cleavage/methylation domain-containing protein
MHIKQRSRCAFTLVEILLAMLISSVLVLGVHAAFRQSLAIFAKTENDRNAYRNARIITETMRNELGGVWFSGEKDNSEENSKGFKLTYLSEASTELEFLTLNPSYTSSNVPAKMSRVYYKFAKDAESGRKMLTRSEQFYSGEKQIGTEYTQTVAENLKDFRVWVLDSNSTPAATDWKENYEKSGRLPKAVKIKMEFETLEPAKTVSFENVFLIASSGGG